jgi:hypothetical protein
MLFFYSVLLLFGLDCVFCSMPISMIVHIQISWMLFNKLNIIDISHHSKESTELQISFLHLCSCMVGVPGISSDESYSTEIFKSFIFIVPPSWAWIDDCIFYSFQCLV